MFFSLHPDVSIEVVDYLLNVGIDVNLQNKQGNTVLHLCDDIEKLNLILKRNPDLNQKNKQSHTPIFKCNNIQKAKALVEAGIDLNVVDDRGQHFLKTLNTMDFDLMKVFIDIGLNRFIEKKGLTLDGFFENWSSTVIQAYYEHKLKTQPELYKIKV